MNKIEKILLGAVAVLAIVVVGLVVSLSHSKGLGVVATTSDQTTNYPGAINLSGDLIVGGNITANNGTTTLGYMAASENSIYSSFNAVSTTLCSVQNTSGQDRVVDNLFIHLAAATSSVTANSSWRGYMSLARADMNANATGTMFTQAVINSSSLPQVFGGPVPSSYYTSSTAFQTGVSGITTSSPVLWRNGWYVNVTSTAITTSTGSCVIDFHPFNAQ